LHGNEKYSQEILELIEKASQLSIMPAKPLS